LKKESPLHNLLLVSGMIGLLVLALILDIVLSGLTERNSQMGGLNVTLVWMYPLVQFIWMLGAIGLAWLMITGGSFSRWVSAIYLIVGLLILYTNPILYVNELPDSLYVVVQYLAPGTMVFQAGGLIAAIGLLSLWFWKAPVTGDSSSKPADEMVDNPEGKNGHEDLS
jgi:hypothetical protein